MLKLDFGAGDIKTEGYLSVDISDKGNPDYVWDITKFPYPKEWEGCDEIRADNVLEHIEPYTLIKVINECNRVLKVGGKFWIRVPLVKMDQDHINGAFSDPTHVNYFTMETFDYYNVKHKRHHSFGKDYGILPWKLIRNEDYPPKFLITELIKL